MIVDVVALAREPVAAFELGVLAEVFGVDRSADGLPGYNFAVAAEGRRRLMTSSGFGIDAAHGIGRIGFADLVAVPSWPRDAVPSARLRHALHDTVQRGGQVLSVCSGAFLLAAVGLLDHRRAATHWRYAAELAARYPAVAVDSDVLYVVDGPVITSAGTAAAIDACLHLVRREHGSAIANRLARAMVVAPHRDGGQAQFVDHPVSRDADPGIGPVLDRAAGDLTQDLTVTQLASWAHLSPRTFVRRFGAATGTTPHHWVLNQRIRWAEHLLETTDLTIPTIAERSGLGSADNLRHQFRRQRGISPSRHRTMFSRRG